MPDAATLISQILNFSLSMFFMPLTQIFRAEAVFFKLLFFQDIVFQLQF